MKETIYTPESKLRRPIRMFKEMFSDLLSSRDLAWRLFIRDTSAQYRQTILGYFWAVFPPLVTSLVFIIMNASNVLNLAHTNIPYPAYVIMGTVLFGLFVDALNAPLKIVNASKAMLVKVNFPREALIISAILQTLLSFSIKLVLLIITLIVFHVPLKLTAFFVPIPLIGLLLLGIMLGILLVPIGLLFQDIIYGLAVSTFGLMILTPVVIPPPEKGLLAIIMSYNPLTPLIMTIRDFVTVGASLYTESMIMIILLTLLMLLIGWVLLRLALPIVVERIGA